MCHHIDIQEGWYVTQARDILAPQQEIAHFDKQFKNERRCSPNLANYKVLKLHANFESFKLERLKRKRKYEGHDLWK